MPKTEHSLHLHVPNKLLMWRYSPVTDFRGWRAFWALWRVWLTVRREPLGSTLPRHGFFLQVMTPWSCCVVMWRGRDWNSLALKTKVSACVGRNAWEPIPAGADLKYRYAWSKEFWRLELLEWFSAQRA
jgi:hypothetical protein